MKINPELNINNVAKSLALSTIFILLMSPFGSKYVLNFEGLYLAELGLLISATLFVISRKELLIEAISQTKSPLFLLTTFTLATLAIIGIINHGNIIAAYTDFRALFLLTCATSLTYRYASDTQSLHWLYWMLIVCLLSNLIGWALIASSDQNESSKFWIPISAILLSMLIPVFLKKPHYLFLSFFLSSLCAAVSSYRMVVVVVIVCLIGYLFSLRKREGSRNKEQVTAKNLIFLATLIAVASLFTYVNLENILGFFTSNESRYIQSVVKWKVLYSYLIGESSAGGGDDTRIFYLQYLSENFLYMIIPQGLGHEVAFDVIPHMFAPTIIRESAGTIDSSWLFILYHAGILTALLLSLFFLYSRKWKIHTIKKDQRGCALITIFSTLFFMSLTAVHFTEISSSIPFGILLGFSARHFFSQSPVRSRETKANPMKNACQ